MKKTGLFVSGLCAALAFSSVTFAKVSGSAAEKLNGALTPMGAVRAGNKDGSIPEWRGGIQSRLALMSSLDNITLIHFRGISLYLLSLLKTWGNTKII